MQLAMLLAALCVSGTGVASFRTSVPRNRAVFDPAVEINRFPAVLHCRILPHTTLKLAGRSLLRGTNDDSYPGEETKADSGSDRDSTAGGIGGDGGGDRSAKANLFQKYGSAGLVAYGLLNGLWYTGGIAYVMLGPMGLVPSTGIEATISASVKQLGKVIGLVWIGSQATKPLRYAMAALLCPAADKLIAFTQRRLGLPKKADAVKILVASIFGSTVVFCVVVIAVAVVRAQLLSPISAAGAATTAASAAKPRRPLKSSAVSLLLLGPRNDGRLQHMGSGRLGRGSGDGSLKGRGLDERGVLLSSPPPRFRCHPARDDVATAVLRARQCMVGSRLRRRARSAEWRQQGARSEGSFSGSSSSISSSSSSSRSTRQGQGAKRKPQGTVADGGGHKDV